MELNLTEQAKMILQTFLLLILPWIIILVGMIFNVENVWYYLLAVTWFCSGVIFLGVLN